MKCPGSFKTYRGQTLLRMILKNMGSPARRDIHLLDGIIEFVTVSFGGVNVEPPRLHQSTMDKHVDITKKQISSFHIPAFLFGIL